MRTTPSGAASVPLQKSATIEIVAIDLYLKEIGKIEKRLQINREKLSEIKQAADATEQIGLARKFLFLPTLGSIRRARKGMPCLILLFRTICRAYQGHSPHTLRLLAQESARLLSPLIARRFVKNRKKVEIRPPQESGARSRKSSFGRSKPPNRKQEPPSKLQSHDFVIDADKVPGQVDLPTQGLPATGRGRTKSTL